MPPIDIPWAVHNESHNMATSTIPLRTVGPPPEYRNKDTVDSVHNHYYTQAQGVAWYRRKRFFYPAVGLVVLVVITCAVVLGVVLKLRAVKSNVSDGHDDASTAVSSSSMSSTEVTSSRILSSYTVLTSSTGSASSAVLASTTALPSSTDLASSTVSITKTASHTSSSTTTPPKATATPFTMSDQSQLASLFVKRGSTAGRRLLVRQDDTDDLVVTEWMGGNVTNYHIREKLGSSASNPKTGTPLAIEADHDGSVHLFYLSHTNIICHLYETAAGKWMNGDVTDERGSIRTSSSSSLSIAWHTGKRTPALLVLAYDNPSQRLQLVIAENLVDRNAWFVADVASVAVEAAPGQSNVPCYSLAGDWLANGTTELGALSHLLIGVVREGEVTPWECAIDFWPPPDVQVQCNKSSKAFIDAKGSGLDLNPIPQQLVWLPVAEQGGSQDHSTGEYDFILLSTDGSSLVRENWVGVGKARSAGLGFTAKSSVTAMSTTTDGFVFVSLGKDVQAFQKSGRKWENHSMLGIGAVQA